MMTDEMWRGVFLTRSVALAGGEENAEGDAWEERTRAFELSTVSGRVFDQIQAEAAEDWWWDVFRYHVRRRTRRS